MYIVGDCDCDDDCRVGLMCGNNNCPHQLIRSFDVTDDCCYKPQAYTLTKSNIY